MAATPSRKRIRLLAAVAAIAVIALVATVLVRRGLAERRYAAAVARLDADEPYWRLDDLVKQLQATPRPDDDNLAVALADAKAAFARPDPEIWQRRGDVIIDPPPNVRLNREQWRVIADCFESNEDAILPALALERFPRGRHVIAYTADGISTLLRHIEDLRQASGVLDDLRFLAVQRGDAATALRVFRTTLNLGRSLREEPMAVSQITRTRYRLTAVRGLERLLGHVAMTDEQLAAVDRELRAELDDDLWPLAARGELALVDRFIGAVRSGLIKPSLLKRLGPVAPPAATPADRAVDWLRDWVGIDVVAEHAELLEAEARSVAAARLPWPERWAAVRQLPAYDDESRPELVRWLTPNFAGMFGNFALDEARVRSALAAVAVERYRLARGDWPPSLAAAGALPDDPFTGRPLRYKRLPDGVAVYSVGTDGADDGGELAETSGGMPRPQTDIGFRLWDVPHRNRPAK